MRQQRRTGLRANSLLTGNLTGNFANLGLHFGAVLGCLVGNFKGLRENGFGREQGIFLRLIRE
jgi:hypothetical protein